MNTPIRSKTDSAPPDHEIFYGYDAAERIGRFAARCGVSRREVESAILSGRLKPVATVSGMAFPLEVMTQFKAEMAAKLKAREAEQLTGQRGEFRVKCYAQKVDAGKGVLRGVTVAQVGEALGHFAYLDASGKVVAVGGKDGGPPQTKRVPLCMDAKSIETVVAAGNMGGRVKARDDHNDAIGSRAGYAENFRMEGGKAVCDMTFYDSYRNRELVLETAAKTPELMGLSGDFKFDAEVIGGRAVMRVTKVDAVDIVDQGALTHAGLFSR